MIDAFKVVRDFEAALSEYTGAPYVVAVNSCTNALLLALRRWRTHECGGLTMVSIPKFTYPSVPASIFHAGLHVSFVDHEWEGAYRIAPTPIWDCAPRFTSGMYIKGQVQCVSFHMKKHLKMGQGGAILHDDPEADAWYRRMRFDGRTEGVPTNQDTYREAGYHCYMSPDDAARGLWLLSSYPKDVPDLPRDNYPDLSERWKA